MEDKLFLNKLLKAMSLCLVAALILSLTQILFKKKQDRNQELEIKNTILKTAGFECKNSQEIEIKFKKYITYSIFNLKDFSKLKDTKNLPLFMQAQSYELKKAINSKHSFKDEVFYNNKVPLYIPVYEVKSNNTIIFPIYGQGLWSQIFAFISIDKKDNHIKSLIFYEQQETPGLGAQIADDKWQKKWQKKLIYDSNKNFNFRISKEKSDKKTAPFQVDAISGATITSNGVHNMIKYWFRKDSLYYKILQGELKLNE